MKAKFEIGGYEIEIEEVDGTITVKAEKDEEIVEEFTLETEESQGGEEDDDDFGDEEDGEIKSFDDFGEEDDFEGDKKSPQGDEGTETSEEEPNEEPNEEPEEKTTLESFQSFINKRR
jgi:hypothetical protein